MKDILLACAMSKEAEALQEQVREYPGLEILASGIGIKRTLPTLLQRFRTQPPELLIFTGSVTQLDPSLAYRQVVLVQKWRLENSPVVIETSPLEEWANSEPEIQTVEFGLSITRPVMRAEKRKALFAQRGAGVYDSLTAAVARVCQTAKIPCLTPKIIANTVDSGLMTFWSRLDENIFPLAKHLNKLLVNIHEK